MRSGLKRCARWRCASLRRIKNQLGLLHNAVYMAVAQKQLHGEEAGCAALCRALEIGQADGIVLPFAENPVYILDMLEKFQTRMFLKPLT